MSIQCVRCNQGSVNVLTDTATVNYKDKTLSYSMCYSLCANCGYEFISTDQIKQNDQAFKKAKCESDGLLTPQEIRNARDTLGINQDLAASIFGGGKNAFSKYERGEVTQSQAMDTLIRLCVKYNGLFREVAAMRSVVDHVTVTNKRPYITVIEGQGFPKSKVRTNFESVQGNYKPKGHLRTLVPQTKYQKAS